MSFFEVGKQYEADDFGFDPITIIWRTKRYVTVTNGQNTWRTIIRMDNKGNEYVMDTSRPKGYPLAWSAKWEVEEMDKLREAKIRELYCCG